tara:strand:+ start:3342 stop:4283 length:942 start_codon:yes stop_codon:yes gene_type:complete
MKFKLSNFCILLLLFLSSANNVESEIKSKIIATVDNQIITSYELKNKIITNIILNNEQINQENIDKLKSVSLKNLINFRLKKKELINANLFNDKIDANEFISRISKNYANNIEDFKDIFKLNNLSYDLYKEEIKIELAWQQLILSLYGNKIKINESEVDDELKKIINNQKNLIEYKLSELEIQITKNKEIDQIIDEIQNLIEKEGFENTAIKYSISLTSMDGGNLGWVNAKSLSDKVLNIVNRLKIGDISEPILQSDTILFLKLNEKKKLDINKINIIETKNRIINQKKNEMLNLFSSSHLSKIRNSASIELK